MNARAGYNLAIETSGRSGSVALGSAADVLETAEFSTSLRHAVELLPTIKRLCRRWEIEAADVGELYVSGGPGSFTGLRIGITVTRTLGWAGGARVVRVPTLDVVAQNALDADDPPPNLGVILDAKRQNVYAAAFVLRANQRYTGEAVARSGLPVLPESTFRARAEVVHRLGFALASAGRYDDPGQVTPIYVRPPEAEEVWEQRQRKEPR